MTPMQQGTVVMLEEARAAGGALGVLDAITRRRGDVAIETLEDPRPEGGLVPVASVPEGRKLSSVRAFLDEYLPHPLRRRGQATLVAQGAFLEHVSRYKGEDTVIFADPAPASPSLRAVYDYHPKGSTSAVEAMDIHPGWCEHNAKLALRMSPEWLAWLGVHTEDLAQGEFAAFINDHIGDCVLVDGVGEQKIADILQMLQAKLGGPQALMRLARGLEINVRATVKNAVTLEDGTVQVKFIEEHADAAGGPVDTPTLFFITIPVFYGGAFYRIPVRLRYKLRGGTILWSFHLYRHDQVFEDAFAELCATVAAATDLPVLLGSPE